MSEEIARVDGRPEGPRAGAAAPPAARRRRAREVAGVEVAEDRGRRVLADVEALSCVLVHVCVRVCTGGFACCRREGGRAGDVGGPGGGGEEVVSKRNNACGKRFKFGG